MLPGKFVVLLKCTWFQKSKRTNLRRAFSQSCFFQDTSCFYGLFMYSPMESTKGLVRLVDRPQTTDHHLSHGRLPGLRALLLACGALRPEKFANAIHCLLIHILRPCCSVQVATTWCWDATSINSLSPCLCRKEEETCFSVTRQTQRKSVTVLIQLLCPSVDC